MSRPAFCSVVSANCLPAAQVLADSLRRFCPDISFHLLLAAEETECRAASERGWNIVRMKDLGIPELPRMLRRYDRFQVVVALKPAIVRHLLESGYSPVVYLDSDILVTADLTPLLEDVARHAVSLTPHIGPGPATAERVKLERALLLAGTFNLGFVGVSDREETHRFLAWWEGRLRTHCKKAVREGFNYDQRWADLAPALVSDLHIVRDPGCNVAYWNLRESAVTRDGDSYRVDGLPLCFFHFSGFSPAVPQMVSRHAPGWRVDQLGPERELFERYVTLLDAAGWSSAVGRSWPWEPVSLWRRLIGRRRPSQRPHPDGN